MKIEKKMTKQKTKPPQKRSMDTQNTKQYGKGEWKRNINKQNEKTN